MSFIFGGSSPPVQRKAFDRKLQLSYRENIMSDFQPYGTLNELANDIYYMDGEWYDTSFRRRMTVVRLRSGGLLIHNAFNLQDADYAKIDALGPVEVIVAPNCFHVSHAHYFKRRYPKAKLFVCGRGAKTISKLCTVDGILPQDWPDRLKGEVPCVHLEGMRFLDETVFFHAASRTLITADMVFNMQNDVKGFVKTIFKINKIYKRFGPSKIFRYVFVSDPGVFKTSLSAILKWDIERVIMSHGDVLPAGGRNLLKSSFSEIGLTP